MFVVRVPPSLFALIVREIARDAAARVAEVERMGEVEFGGYTVRRQPLLQCSEFVSERHHAAPD